MRNDEKVLETDSGEGCMVNVPKPPELYTEKMLTMLHFMSLLRHHTTQERAWNPPLTFRSRSTGLDAGSGGLPYAGKALCPHSSTELLSGENIEST